jgi:HD domain-containing protein
MAGGLVRMDGAPHVSASSAARADQIIGSSGPTSRREDLSVPFASPSNAPGPRARPAPAASRILPAAAVLVAAFAVFAVVRTTGGLPNAFNNVSYLVIVIASLAYGARGGLAATVLLAALLGPLGAATGMSVDSPPSFLIRVASMAAVGVLNGALVERTRHLAERWRQTARRVEERQQAGMLALARGAEAKDETTGDHLRRVRVTAEQLALATGSTRQLATDIGWAAMLHDVGKLHVPDALLRKPGPLTPDELAVVRDHTIEGERILGDCPGYEIARKVARWHHENIDGTGYPDGLRGAAIPLEARIVRIADAFDAMTNDRPYAVARTIEQAMDELRRYRGTQFDPELVELLQDLVAGDSLLRRLHLPRAGVHAARRLPSRSPGRGPIRPANGRPTLAGLGR